MKVLNENIGYFFYVDGNDDGIYFIDNNSVENFSLPKKWCNKWGQCQMKYYSEMLIVDPDSIYENSMVVGVGIEIGTMLSGFLDPAYWKDSVFLVVFCRRLEKKNRGNID